MSLLDLPSEILRKIITYLTDADVYFNVRNASHRLQMIAKDVVKLGKLLLFKQARQTLKYVKCMNSASAEIRLSKPIYLV